MHVPTQGTRGDNVYFNTQVSCFFKKVSLGDLVHFVETAEWLEIPPDTLVALFHNFAKQWVCIERGIAFYVEPKVLIQDREVTTSRRIFCPLYNLDLARLRNFVDKALEEGCEPEAKVMFYGRGDVCPLPFNYAAGMRAEVPLE